MEENEENNKSFHVQLLSKLIDVDQYPFIKLMIENDISKEEYTELFQLLHTLEEKYVQQKSEGFLDFTALLINFVGMLNEKLEPNETIQALEREGYFPHLIKDFMRLLKQGIDLPNV